MSYEGNEQSRICNGCKETLPLISFSKMQKGKYGRRAVCKECTSKHNEKYRLDNPEKTKETRNRWRLKDKDVTRDKSRNDYYKRKFGITLEDYNSIFSSQNGCCLICLRHQVEFSKSLAVDHDHKTGKIRGLLCSFCNTGIGLLQEKIENLQRAIDYLDDK